MRLAVLNRAFVQPVATDNKARKDKQQQNHIADTTKKVEAPKDGFEVWMDKLGAGIGVVAIIFGVATVAAQVGIWMGWM
jgi:hypothetical protein